MGKSATVSLACLAVIIAACDPSTAPTPPTQIPPTADTALCKPSATAGLPGCWTWQGTGLHVADMTLALTVRSDNVIEGRWSGHLASCVSGSVCVPAGIVSDGTLTGDRARITLTALNSDFSVTFDGRIAGQSMTGEAAVFRNAQQGNAVPVTFAKQ